LPVSARADSAALMLCIPAPLAAALQLQQESLRALSVADGRVLKVPYVGPLRVDFEGRCCFVGALVLSDEVLLGTVPMEDMDVIVNPTRESGWRPIPAARRCRGPWCDRGAAATAARHHARKKSGPMEPPAV